jgi:hypothetical protein
MVQAGTRQELYFRRSRGHADASDADNPTGLTEEEEGKDNKMVISTYGGSDGCIINVNNIDMINSTYHNGMMTFYPSYSVSTSTNGEKYTSQSKYKDDFTDDDTITED